MKNEQIQQRQEKYKNLSLIKSKKIMIVDDECFNRYSVTAVLEIAGIQNIDEICVDAENGQKALEIIVSDV